MSYVLVDSGTVIKYPYSITELRNANSNTSFPASPSEELLSSYGVFPVAGTPQPASDPIMQDVFEDTPADVEGQWTQSWRVVDATPEEIEARKAQQIDIVRFDRSNAYRNEADPIFFMAQRGEATTEEWLAKVDEIKARYPYPSWYDPS